MEATSGFGPEDNGFADRGLTTWLCRRKQTLPQEGAHLERITGLEPATSTLARWRSTK